MGERKRLSEVPGFKSPAYYPFWVEIESNRAVVEVPPSPTLEALIESKLKVLEEVLGVPVELKKVDSEPSVGLKKTGILMGDPLSHEMTPAGYVISKNNEEACKAVEALLGVNGPASLVIYGPPGVGKTHLLQATAWKALGEGLNVAHFKAGSLADLMFSAFKNSSAPALRKELAGADLVAVDDFQLFNEIGKRSLISFLFQVVDYLLAVGRKIVVTSDTRPTRDAWPKIDERLLQRIMLSGAVLIRPPDGQFCKAFLKHKLGQLGVEVTDDALEAAARLNVRSVRDLGRLVWYAASRGWKKVDADRLFAAAADVLGLAEISKITPGPNLWARVLSEVLPPLEAEQVFSGSALRGDLKRIASMLKAAFVGAMRERGASLSEIASQLGISKPAVVKWEAKHKEMLSNPGYQVVLAKVREVLKVCAVQHKGGKRWE